MAALGDGTDSLPHSLLFPTEGLNQECGFRHPPPPSVQQDLTHYWFALTLSFLCSLLCSTVIERVYAGDIYVYVGL